jgi:hypothetical protein
MRKKKRGNKRVSEKISVLRHEGVPEKQAVAESLSMERSHRLGRHGKYRHVGRRGRRKGHRG